MKTVTVNDIGVLERDWVAMTRMYMEEAAIDLRVRHDVVPAYWIETPAELVEESK